MQMSIDAYEQHCKDFFARAENTATAIEAQVSALSIDAYYAWQNDLFERYDAATKDVIRSMVSGLDVDDESEEAMATRRVARAYHDVNNRVCNTHVFDLACVQQKTAEQRAAREAAERERLLSVRVGDRQFKAESVIDVLWSGWECDSHAWLVRDEGVARLVTTDHGTAQFSDRSFLEARLKEYQDAIEQTQAMLNALDN